MANDQFGFPRERLGEHPPPVGQWEFGSAQWCDACAAAGVDLLREADIDLDGLRWGFSEIYTHCPARLLAGRSESAYHFMIRDGQISGGGGAPIACRELPGFHVSVPWGSIASQSAGFYGRAGQRLRSADERVMWREIEQAVGRKDPFGLANAPPAVWPEAIGRALGRGAESGAGLHNISASLLIPSPEVSALPLSEHGVPRLAEMTSEQRSVFLQLLGL